MPIRALFFGIAGLLVLTLVMPVQAATIQFSTTVALNISYLNPAHTSYLQEISGPTFMLKAGDTITGEITFSSPLSIFVPAGRSFEHLDFMAVDRVQDPQTHWTGTVQVLGLTGDLGLSNPLSIEYWGGAIVGASIDASAGRSFTFTGLAFTLNVLSVTVEEQEISAPFYFGRVAISAGEGAVDLVPEPSTTGLIMGGLLFLFLCENRLTRSRKALNARDSGRLSIP